MKKIKIFVGEDEEYEPILKNAFLNHLKQKQFEIKTKTYSAIMIPTDYDLYLLSLSHYPLEQIKELYKESSQSVIMLRCRHADLLSHVCSREEPWSLKINGFYTFSVIDGFEKDLPKKCLEKLNIN